MRSCIQINQEEVCNAGWQDILSLNHLAVFTVIADELETAIDGEPLPIPYDFIVSQLPLLHIKKDRCRQLVKALVEVGLLSTDRFMNQQNGGTFFQKGAHFDKISREG